ncbi:MAG: phosphoribosylformylglycinamidine synthase subunit PurQ [Deltaproteobacteria bacterium]|nr:phosphoribosylformylglycinamidine synthase subunit PurQ [Deltaproteobacteria bacterium]
MKELKALVLTGYGLNCDIETAYACELAGAIADRVHINDVIRPGFPLDEYSIMVFTGGFSWGDDHGAGVIQAVRMKKNAGDRILRFVEDGNLILGICNGFQTIVNMGLLPGFDGNYTSRRLALTYNDSGNFVDQWVNLAVNPDSPCVFTQGMDAIELPVRHGEGKLAADDAVINRLEEENQVVCRYALADGSSAAGKFPENPNGSINDIAGICDPSGRIFGLMPHPEGFNHPTNHPDWCRKKANRQENAGFSQTGISIFENAVKWLQGR